MLPPTIHPSSTRNILSGPSQPSSDLPSNKLRLSEFSHDVKSVIASKMAILSEFSKYFISNSF